VRSCERASFCTSHHGENSSCSFTSGCARGLVLASTATYKNACYLGLHMRACARVRACVRPHGRRCACVRQRLADEPVHTPQRSRAAPTPPAQQTPAPPHPRRDSPHPRRDSCQRPSGADRPRLRTQSRRRCGPVAAAQVCRCCRRSSHPPRHAAHGCHTQACTHIHTSARTHTLTRTHIPTRTRNRTCMHTHEHMHTDTHRHVCACKRAHLCARTASSTVASTYRA
jgi:hypothetical protein